MSESEDQRRASELSRLWQGQVVPVEDEEATAQQRARVVPQIAAAVDRAATHRRRHRRTRMLVAALSAAAMVAGSIGLVRVATRHHAAASARTASNGLSNGVRALAGTVTLVSGAGPRRVSEATVEVGNALSTAADGRAELRLTDLVLAEIDGSSELSIVTPTISAHRLRLDRGRIRAHVNDRPSVAPKLVVETPNVDVIVTGTIFQVDVKQGRNPMEFVTTVSVTKGRVVVRRGGKTLAAVTGGQSWSSASKAMPPEAPAPLAPRAQRSVAPPGRTSRPGTLAQENSLFQDAVDARNQGDDGAEAEHLATLLTRYPSSPLAGEARVERMRALQRSGQALEAAREARRYLAEYPEGFAREEARRIVMQDGAASR